MEVVGPVWSAAPGGGQCFDTTRLAAQDGTKQDRLSNGKNVIVQNQLTSQQWEGKQAIEEQTKL